MLFGVTLLHYGRDAREPTAVLGDEAMTKAAEFLLEEFGLVLESVRLESLPIWITREMVDAPEHEKEHHIATKLRDKRRRREGGD